MKATDDTNELLNTTNSHYRFLLKNENNPQQYTQLLVICVHSNHGNRESLS